MSGRRVFLLGTSLGAAIWLASPLVTGFREPWDAPSGYYSTAVLLAGALLGVLAPPRFWVAGLAVLVGQFLVFAAYALFPPQELWLLGVVALIVYSGLGFGGAIVGALGVVLARRVRAWLRSRDSAPG